MGACSWDDEKAAAVRGVAMTMLLDVRMKPHGMLQCQRPRMLGSIGRREEALSATLYRLRLSHWRQSDGGERHVHPGLWALRLLWGPTGQVAIVQNVFFF
jgi:hypothetical protein